MQLEEIAFGDVHVDKWFNCEGMWLDKGEFEAIQTNEPGFVGRLLNVFRSGACELSTTSRFATNNILTDALRAAHVLQQRASHDDSGDGEIDDQARHTDQSGHKRGRGASRIETDPPKYKGQH